jgi:hypothetical protein
VIIDGEAINQLFGFNIQHVPDITGDGKPEIATSIVSGLGPASAYLITSEFYGSVQKGVLSVANLGNSGTRFAQTPRSGSFPISFPYETRANLLTALPRPNESGVDLLLSDGGRRKFYLFELTQPSDYSLLRGTIDPDTISNAIVYSVGPAEPAKEARLVGDVDGDGRNDILVQDVHTGSPGASDKWGLILGRPVSSPADRARTAALNIEFTRPTTTSPGVPFLLTKLVSDISGDGHPDFLMLMPSSNDDALSVGPLSGALLLVRSPVLRGVTPSSPAVSFSADAATSIFEVNDIDGDGVKSIAVGSKVIDGDDLNNGVSNILLMAPPTADSTGGVMMAAIGDLDSDGLGDFVSSPATGGIISDVYRGALLRRGQRQTADPDPGIPGSRRINLRSVIPYVNPRSGQPPVYLATSGLVAFGVVHRDFSQTTIAATAGRIIFVKEADIEASVTTPSAPNVVNEGLIVR